MKVTRPEAVKYCTVGHESPRAHAEARAHPHIFSSFSSAGAWHPCRGIACRAADHPDHLRVHTGRAHTVGEQGAEFVEIEGTVLVPVVHLDDRCKSAVRRLVAERVQHARDLPLAERAIAVFVECVERHGGIAEEVEKEAEAVVMPTCAALHAVVWASGALLPTLPSGAVCVRERLVDGLSDIFGREAVLRWVLLGQLAEGLEVDAVSVEFAHGRRDLVLEEKRAAGLQRLVELVLAHDAITIGVEAVEDPFERRMPLGRLGHHYKVNTNNASTAPG
mmetsp:Transcript_4333/g.9919  ORF Transcript_4333/g.9919 Transcript_4333/m.9919 type:complete len:277 (-) Transcript_4333:199-1029(-)